MLSLSYLWAPQVSPVMHPAAWRCHSITIVIRSCFCGRRAMCMQYKFCHFMVYGCIACEAQYTCSVLQRPLLPPPAPRFPYHMPFAEGLVAQIPSSHSPLSMGHAMADLAGTGKSTYVNKHLVQGLPKESWAPIFITFSARTTANMAQEQVCAPPPFCEPATTLHLPKCSCCVRRSKTQAMNQAKHSCVATSLHASEVS